MRISDWSSDVCSSDLAVVVLLAGAAGVVGVVLGSLGKADEVLHRERSVVAEEVDRDVTLVGLQGGLEVSHDCLSSRSGLFPQIFAGRGNFRHLGHRFTDRKGVGRERWWQYV